MSYAQYGNIQASDFNNLVGSNPDTNANRLNTVWATGGTTAGYGQTAVPQVSAGGSVAAADWANLVNKTSNVASHQGTSITAVTAPSAGGAVTYLSAIPTNLTSVYTNRLNAATQSGTSANTATRSTTWSNAITFTHTINFTGGGDAARYFFNAGGQIKITLSHPTGTAIDNLFNGLASDVGTIVISSPSSTTTVTVVGTSYRGVQKVGGDGTNTPTVYDQTRGYYGLTTTNVEICRHLADSGAAGYLSSYISISARTSTATGSNGDNGNVITITTLWDEVPNGYAVAIGSATTVTLSIPETTYIANTWGAITLSGTVSGT